jgi:DNA-binding MurR/RpiR family transcriptional regulator
MTDVPADPPIGGTTSLIRSILPSLGPSEQRVAQLCVDAPADVAMLSVADLAARTDTSPATVIRTCQNLGFKGFQHLRLLLLRDLGAHSDDTPVPDAAGSRGRVPALFDAAARDLRNALGALDFDAFDEAASAIHRANRVLIVANGGSGPAAQMLALRFITTARPCEAPYDSVTQQLAARLLAPTDVCIAVSDSGMNSTTLAAVDAAHAAGATIIGVTSYGRSRLSDVATFSIVAGATFHSWGDGAVTGNLTQMLILSALQEAVARIDRPDASMDRRIMDEVMGIVSVDEGPLPSATTSSES